MDGFKTDNKIYNSNGNNKKNWTIFLENGQMGIRDGYGGIILTLKHSDCYKSPLYFVPEHGNCHGISRRMQTFYAIRLPCSGTR
jgi:hypothetical protein